MINVVYVTGNPQKARYFSRMVGLDIPHQKADVDELQILDLQKIVEHKAKEAYRIVGKPVLVEDTSVRFEGMGALPGPYIKWFLEELGADNLSVLAETYDPGSRRAVCGAMIAYYDGINMHVFKNELAGSIAKKPIGNASFGWNPLFIPEGQALTVGQLSQEDFELYYKKFKPFGQVRKFLDSL